jgi:glutamyl-tRNA synthetase
LGDIIEQGDFFFTAPTQFDETTARKKWNSEVAGVLSEFAQRLIQLESIEPMDAKNLLIGILEIRGMGLGKVMPGLRLALTGANGGPDLMEIIVILGPKEAANRIDYAVKTITN